MNAVQIEVLSLILVRCTKQARQNHDKGLLESSIKCLKVFCKRGNIHLNCITWIFGSRFIHRDKPNLLIKPK